MPAHRCATAFRRMIVEVNNRAPPKWRSQPRPGADDLVDGDVNSGLSNTRFARTSIEEAAPKQIGIWFLRKNSGNAFGVMPQIQFLGLHCPFQIAALRRRIESESSPHDRGHAQSCEFNLNQLGSRCFRRANATGDVRRRSGSARRSLYGSECRRSPFRIYFFVYMIFVFIFLYSRFFVL
jgi:hypothetical protein